MKFAMKYIILYVEDLNKAIRFYGEILGLTMKMQQGTYVEFDTGVTTLSINTRQSIRDEIGLEVPSLTTSTQTFEIGFVVDNVAETIDMMRAQGVKVVKEPTEKPWGQIVAYVADPDGHYIEICTSID
ncbi:MAG: VOC family protein [Solibacillus sp.]|jgi:lactoylglutathione lyase|uniref:VOC family protein n=1 Tax=unclassified Solibacillus TaxID=2637870 RepID=UPI0030FCD96A